MLFAAVLCCNHAFLFGSRSYCFDIQFVFEENILLIFRDFGFGEVEYHCFGKFRFEVTLSFLPF